VYVEEISSGVRTVVGVATSRTAFVGRAPKGLVDTPTAIRSFAEYELHFGGLSSDSTMSYAVRDFFRNGGGDALVVRVFGGDADAATASITYSGLTVRASSPGRWANGLRIRVTKDTSPAAADVAARLGLAVADLFDLTVRDTTTKVTEVFHNVTCKADSARRVDRVLAAESRLVAVAATSVPSNPPAAHGQPPGNPPAPGAEWLDPFSAPVDSDGADGAQLTNNDFTGAGLQVAKRGLFALEKADLFNLLCIPPYAAGVEIETGLIDAAATYCEQRRAMLLIDPPSGWTSAAAAVTDYQANGVGTASKNAAVFFPPLREVDPLQDGRLGTFAPCGAVAGICARTDGQRGVWKAPAGLDASVAGVAELAVKMTDAENGDLNQLGVNCIRTFPGAGTVVWGSRTLEGADQRASEWKYIPVRRTALFLEESLFRGTKWVVFEPNDEPLWAQIRLSVGAFMQNLFRQGAFQGKSPRDAYFVRCDSDTTTQNDIDRGIVNILIGFAPLKPAEFVVVSIQQLAGQIDT
jgi:hypothetical protein